MQLLKYYLKTSHSSRLKIDKKNKVFLHITIDLNDAF